MSLVSFITKTNWSLPASSGDKNVSQCNKDQSPNFYYLITKAEKTKFGKDHQFTQIENIRDYQQESRSRTMNR